MRLICPTCQVGDGRLVGGNDFDGARNRGLDGLQDLRYQRSEIGKPIRPCVKHNDGDRESGEVLLEGEVSIDRYEHVELRSVSASSSPFLMASQPI